MTRSWLVIGVLTCASCAAAREDSVRPGAARERPPVLSRPALQSPSGPQPVDGDPPAPQQASEPRVDADVRYDLVRHAHMADVRHEGALLIDLGSPSAVRYTLGGWRSGWGRDRQDGDVTYAVSGERSRIYFSAASSGPGFVRVRGKGGTVRLTLNDRPLEPLQLPGGDAWVTVQAAVPAETLHAGENLLIVRPSRGETVRVDRIEIGEGDPAGAPGVAATESLVTSAMLGAAELPALKLPAGTRLSYSLQAPAQASLRFAVSSTDTGSGATLTVSVEGDGAPAETLYTSPVTAGAPVQKTVELASFAGGVVRVDISAEGPSGSEVLLVAPRIVVPRTDRPLLTAGPAKNVLIVLVDTLRADKLRPYNPRSRVVTETFDDLAADGVLFEQASPQENWTKPSVATLLTGLYPSSHNTKTDSAVLPAEAEMLSEILQGHGFETAAFIANGYVSERFGFHQGWAFYRNYVRQEIANRAEFVARDVLEWLDRRNRDRPFFLYVHAIDPHVPYSPPTEFLRRYDPGPYAGRVQASRTALLLEDIKTGRFSPDERDRQRLEALYDGEVTYNDVRMATVFQGLRDRGLLDETLVVFTSDHGEEFFDHGSVGHGHSLYRELVHVPLVMRLAGRLPAGRRITDNVGLVDVLPTVLDLLGLPQAALAQGESLAALMRGEARDAPDGALSEFLDTQRSVTSGRYKLVLRGTTPALYDLETDSGEQRNVAAERPIALRHLRSLVGMLVAGADTPSGQARPRRPRRVLDRVTTTIDPETEEQLRALGYIGTSRPR